MRGSTDAFPKFQCQPSNYTVILLVKPHSVSLDVGCQFSLDFLFPSFPSYCNWKFGSQSLSQFVVQLETKTKKSSMHSTTSERERERRISNKLITLNSIICFLSSPDSNFCFLFLFSTHLPIFTPFLLLIFSHPYTVKCLPLSFTVFLF